MAALLEQTSAAHRRDLLLLREDLAAETSGKIQAAKLTEDIASMASRNEQECSELIQAMELERAARVSEASELRAMVLGQKQRQQARDASSAYVPEVEELLLRQRRFEERFDAELKQHLEGTETRESQLATELSACSQLSCSTAERLAKLKLPEARDDTAQDEDLRAKARIENMVGNAIGHAEQLEQKLAAATGEIADPSAANQDAARLAEEVRAARTGIRQIAVEVERFKSRGANSNGGDSPAVDKLRAAPAQGVTPKAKPPGPQQQDELPRKESSREAISTPKQPGPQQQGQTPRKEVSKEGHVPHVPPLLELSGAAEYPLGTGSRSASGPALPLPPSMRRSLSAADSSTAAVTAARSAVPSFEPARHFHAANTVCADRGSTLLLTSSPRPAHESQPARELPIGQTWPAGGLTRKTS